MRWRKKTSEGSAAAPLCSCGSPLDPVDMDYGFQLPDVAFALSPDERSARLRGRSKLVVMDESRAFVRTVLPVQLDSGSVTFGIWLEIPIDQADQADPVWDEPAYASLVFEGRVANHLEPWGAALVGAKARAAPRDENALPYVHDGDEIVRSMLHRTWSRKDVVEALPGLAPSHG